MLIKFIQKLMLVFAFRPPIHVPNFSKIEARTHKLWRFLHKLWRFLQSVRNDKEEEKKRRNFYEILPTHILGTAKGILKRGLPFMEANSTVNFVPFG